MSQFDGSNPNGTWSLYVDDQAFMYSGSITNWSLTIDTPTPPAPAAATGKRAAALKKCKKKTSRARKKCKKKANLLPV
jgi:subtilisin-like proprotein convertase family protein